MGSTDFKGLIVQLGEIDSVIPQEVLFHARYRHTLGIAKRTFKPRETGEVLCLNMAHKRQFVPLRKAALNTGPTFATLHTQP